jgi:hypothetical protein
MDLEETRLEGKKLFTEGMSVGEWFNLIEAKCGVHKTHLLIAVCPFPSVVVRQQTMGTHGRQIMLSLAEKITSGECVLIQDRYFFFTESVDAVVFKLFWHHPQ